MDESIFVKISNRGDAYGGHGGLLDLLYWCGKIGVCQVSQEEAFLFWKNPKAPYPTYFPKSA